MYISNDWKSMITGKCLIKLYYITKSSKLESNCVHARVCHGILVLSNIFKNSKQTFKKFKLETERI